MISEIYGVFLGFGGFDTAGRLPIYTPSNLTGSAASRDCHLVAQDLKVRGIFAKVMQIETNPA